MSNLFEKLPTDLEEHVNSFLDTDSRVGLILALGIESKQAALYKSWIINPQSAFKTFHQNILFFRGMYHYACDPNINHIYSLVCRNDVDMLQYIVRHKLFSIPNCSFARLSTHGCLPNKNTKKMILQLSQAIRKVIIVGVSNMYFVENDTLLFDDSTTQKTKLIQLGIYQKQFLRTKTDQPYFD